MTLSPRCGILAGLVPSLILAASHVQAQAHPVAITGATLWDGSGSAALPAAVVIVQAGRITCVGAGEQCPVPADATRLDARGRYLIPGLIDTHVHLLFRQNGVTDTSIKADLHDLLARGITTVRDMGNNPSRLLEAVDSAGPAPRVFAMQLVAGVQFFRPEVERSPDGNVRTHAPASIGMKQLGWWPILYTPSTDPESVIRQAKAAGAIGLKLYQDMDSAQVAALVVAAHAAGMPVWGHGWVQPASVLEQAQAGQDGVVHAAGLTGELIARAARDSMRSSTDLLRLTADSATADAARRPAVLATLDSLAARGTFFEPTLRAEELGAERARVSRKRIQALPNRYALAASVFGMEVTRQAVAHGVRITAGTDHVAFGPVEERAQLAEELQLFVDSLGLTPARALLAATRDAALAIGTRGADLGTIAPGKVADLVLFREDPVTRIENLNSVEWVMRAGVMYQPDALRALPTH
jgi:imidazolonepropionase-like amidohydrolase